MHRRTKDIMGYRLLTKIYKTKVIFNFEYFNTAYSKVIMDIIEKLKILQDNGSQPAIKWYYIEEDDDMLEAGKDYSDITEIPFNFISYQ